MNLHNALTDEQEPLIKSTEVGIEWQRNKKLTLIIEKQKIEIELESLLPNFNTRNGIYEIVGSMYVIKIVRKQFVDGNNERNTHDVLSDTIKLLQRLADTGQFMTFYPIKVSEHETNNTKNNKNYLILGGMCYCAYLFKRYDMDAQDYFQILNETQKAIDPDNLTHILNQVMDQMLLIHDLAGEIAQPFDVKSRNVLMKFEKRCNIKTAITEIKLCDLDGYVKTETDQFEHSQKELTLPRNISNNKSSIKNSVLKNSMADSKYKDGLYHFSYIIGRFGMTLMPRSRDATNLTIEDFISRNHDPRLIGLFTQLVHSQKSDWEERRAFLLDEDINPFKAEPCKTKIFTNAQTLFTAQKMGVMQVDKSYEIKWQLPIIFNLKGQLGLKLALYDADDGKPVSAEVIQISGQAVEHEAIVGLKLITIDGEDISNSSYENMISDLQRIDANTRPLECKFER